MEVSGEHHTPAALTSGKEPPTPIGYEPGWAPESVWTLCNTEQYFVPAGNRIPVVQPAAIAIELCWVSQNSK